MTIRTNISILLSVAVTAFVVAACGGASPDDANTPADVDPIADPAGDVDAPDTAAETEKPAPAGYTGPTALTVNLRVVNDKNPGDAMFTLTNGEGAVVVDKGKLGEPVEIPQGKYTLEFKSSAVFGEPGYKLEDVEITGETQSISETFPAGQITLNTYRGNNQNKCVPVTFTVHNLSSKTELTGQGKTCKSLILESGHYEVRLNISKKSYQPVEMRISQEQVQTSSVKLEK